MNALTTLLPSVFDPLLETSLQAGAVILVIMLLRAVLGQRLSGRWLHTLWLVVLVKLALPWTPQVEWSPFAWVPSVRNVGDAPAADPIPPSTPLPPGASEPWTLANAGPAAFGTTSHAPGSARPDRDLGTNAIELRHVLYATWLTGIAVLLTLVVMANWRFWRAVTDNRPLTDQAVLNLLEDCKSAMGVRVPVEIIVTPLAASPALLGFVRPRLLLPPGVIESLDRDELRHVFLHELAHLRRHDVLLGWIACLVQIVHWCNPLVWLAGSRMRADRELACDALAISALPEDEPRRYGATILKLLERCSRPRYLPVLTGILEDRTQLRRRISMIAQFNTRRHGTTWLGLVCLLTLGAIALTDAPAQPAETSKTDTPRTADERYAPDKVYTIRPGKGLDLVAIGDSVKKVESVLGTPAKKHDLEHIYRYAYDSVGIELIVPKQSECVAEMAFDRGFRGRLEQGLGMGSSLDDVAAKTGGIKQRIDATAEGDDARLAGGDRVLYSRKPGKEPFVYELTDVPHGINYRFDGDKKLVQVVVYPATEMMDLDNLPDGSRLDERGNIVDRTDWPFVNDPEVLGKWESVDLVRKIEDFKPGTQSWGKLYLKGMVFEADGKANFGFMKWTKGKVIHEPDKTAAAYAIKEIGGATYMSLEWKSGDYSIRHHKPAYYVLKKLPGDSSKFSNPRELLDLEQEWPEVELGPNSHLDDKGRIVDKIDYPFVNDPDVIGTWKSVDFVKTKAQFRPGKRNWKGDLFLKEMVFAPDGKLGPRGRATWTRGLVLSPGDQTASAYEIVEKDGAEYLFLEWKSGDYKVLHRRPAYYVLKKEE